MLFRWAVESADRLIVSSGGNHTDIRSIVPKRPQADVTNASPLYHCWHRCCFPFAEQPTVSQPEKPEYSRVIGHNIDVFIVLVDERFDQAVCVATMFTCTLFPPPPHLHCIYIRESFSLLMTMLISFYFLWIISWLYRCIGRFVSIVSLIVWHNTAAPLLARFDRSFVISNEYSYTYGSSLSFWSYAEGVGSPRFNRWWRRQVPCSSRSSCPVYVVVAPTYFPQATVIVE